MTRYRILTWGGIPAQLKIFPERGRPRSVELPGWFMQEIDRVATRDGIVGADEYLERWQWSEDIERAGSLDEVAATVTAELEQQWMRPRRSPSTSGEAA